MQPRIAYLDIKYIACCYVASDILHMTLVNLTINGLQIYSVKSPIHRLVPYQPPDYIVPATDILNSEYIYKPWDETSMENSSRSQNCPV